MPPTKRPAGTSPTSETTVLGSTPKGSPPKSSRRTRVQSDFPKSTLEDAVRVATAIEEANAGRPYPPTDVAIALDMSPGGSPWRVLTAASYKYGLTTGSYVSERLELTPLAQRIVAPTSAEDRIAALYEAALSPPTFKAIYEHLKGKKIPAAQFLENTLVRDFAVPKEHATIADEIFTRNAQYTGLTRTTQNGQWLGTQPVGSVANTRDEINSADVVGEEEDSTPKPQSGHADNHSSPDIRAPKAPPTSPRGKGQAIFVGHGKNKKPLEQLQKILNEYGIPFKIAIDEANKGRPISEKVAEVMEECGAAIRVCGGNVGGG